MKNWFSNCFPLMYICFHCDEVCIFWHFGAPGTPGFYVRAQHDPEKRSHMKNFLSIIFHCCTYVWWGLHDTLTPLDSTYGSPGPRRHPKIKNNKCSSDYFHILHVVGGYGGYILSEIYFKMFMGPWSIYIKCLGVLLTHVYWFRATGGYICSCGRPSNLVISPFECTQGILWFSRH